MKGINFEFNLWLVLSRLFFALVKTPLVVLVGVLGLIFVPFAWLVGYKLSGLGYSIAAGWLYFLTKILFGLTVRGRENLPEGNFILVATHQSYWDIPVLALAVGLGRALNFVAREGFSFLKWAPVSDFCIFIDREGFDMGDMRKLLRAAREGLKERPLAVFPEGTTKPDKKEVKGSSLSFAEMTSKKIVPIVFKSDGPYGKPRGSTFAYFTSRVNLTVEIKAPLTLEELKDKIPKKEGEKTSSYYKRLIKRLLWLQS